MNLRCLNNYTDEEEKSVFPSFKSAFESKYLIVKAYSEISRDVLPFYCVKIYLEE